MDGHLLNLRYKRRTAALATLLAISVLMFGGALLYNLVQLRKVWIEYSYETTQRTEALARIHRAAGYGGFIHNFKNYVLRQDPAYLKRLENDTAEIFSALDAYRRLTLSDEELAALAAIHKTFNAYLDAVTLAETSVRNQLTSTVLDRRVLISDNAAIDALTVLKSAHEQYKRETNQRMQSEFDFLINMLLIGLLAVPLIGFWAHRHMGLLERLAESMLARNEMQRMLARSEEETGEALKRSEAYKHLAYRCALTQIPNRQAFNEAATKALDSARDQQEKLAVLYVDVDDFKGINDRFGHKTGDQVLTEIAGRLDRVLRGDDLVARIGGDEFAILIFGRDALKAKEQLADRILAALREPFDEIQQGLQVSCSVGGAIAPDQGDDVDALLKAADTRMYVVKKSGKDGAMIG
ncbi:MAG: GGDEF domain-containing protein [Oceanospirillaceae bacterium]|nr:GGDEF domain-containing protein [Oceanospirillaceae bacterium]